MQKRERRILGRQLAKELTQDDLKKISGAGGTTSCCCPYGADDCDDGGGGGGGPFHQSP